MLRNSGANYTSLRPYAEAWQRYFRKGKTRSLEWLQKVVKSGHLVRDTGIYGEDFHKAIACVGFEGFFSRFGFDVVDGVVSFTPEPLLTEEEKEDLEEQRAHSKASPYTDAGWRQVGVASSMVVALCERLGRKVRIIHNDRCIWDFTPPKTTKGEMIVLSVWGDHAFFYKDTIGAQLVKMAPVYAVPEMKLACRLEYERVPTARWSRGTAATFRQR